MVKFLNESGASVEVWNRKNSSGWVLRTIMTAPGVSTVLEPEKVVSGATPTK